MIIFRLVRMCLMSPRQRHVYLMLRAINYARQPVWIGEKRQSIIGWVKGYKKI